MIIKKIVSTDEVLTTWQPLLVWRYLQCKLISLPPWLSEADNYYYHSFPFDRWGPQSCREIKQCTWIHPASTWQSQDLNSVWLQSSSSWPWGYPASQKMAASVSNFVYFQVSAEDSTLKNYALKKKLELLLSFLSLLYYLYSQGDRKDSEGNAKYI